MTPTNKLLLAAIVLTVIAVGVTWLGRSTEPAGAQGPPIEPLALDGTVYCVDAGKAVGSFWWNASSPWDEAWVDLSLQNNGFIPGTFLSAGPTPVEVAGPGAPTPYYGHPIWVDLIPGVTHYWRVNLRYGDKWYASPTLTYTPTCSIRSAIPTSTPSEIDRRLGDVEDRLAKIERCLKWNAPLQCSSRLDDIEGRLEDLERGW